MSPQIKSIVQIGTYPLSAECIHGGVEASVYGLAQELARCHTVHVFDVPRIGGEDSVVQCGSLTVHRYVNPGTHNRDATMRLAEMVRDIMKLCPDVCHIHGTGAFSKHVYFALKQKGVPVLLTVHGLLREEKHQALLRQPSLKHLYQYVVQTHDERTLLNAAPHVIVDTPYVENKLRTYKLHHLPEIHVIPQGIDNQYFSINNNPNGNILLSVGAISPRKGHIYTVEMFNILRTGGADAKLRIIGSLADVSYYALLQQQISNSPFGKDISLEINVPRENVMKAYTEARLFVLHSREESQGIVFAEAMAAGLPVVATNVGGIPYVVENGKTGLLCPFGEAKMMADMVHSLLANDTLRHRFSHSARLAARNYDWEQIASGVEALYGTISDICS